MRTFHRRRAFGAVTWIRPSVVWTPAPPEPPPTVIVPEVLPPAGVLTLADVLKRSHTRVARLVFVGPDLQTILYEVGPAELPSGSSLAAGIVTSNRRHELRRTGSASIADRGLYTPSSPASLVYPNRLVRIEDGVVVDGTVEWVALMTGLIGKPRVQPAGGHVTFSLASRLHLLDRPFPRPITFAVGTRIQDLIRVVCELGGLGTADALYDLDDGGAVLLAERPFDTNERMLGATLKVVHDQGVDGPYDDGLGRVVCRPFVDPTSQAPVWTFRVGLEAHITSLEWEVDAPPIAYNRQQVFGIAADHYPIVAEWRDLNPLSPTYNPPDGSGPLGDLPAQPHISTEIHNQRAALAVAQKLGIERTLASRPLTGRLVPVPLIDAARGDVIAFESVEGVTTTAWLQQLTHPVFGGEASFEALDIRALVGAQ